MKIQSKLPNSVSFKILLKSVLGVLMGSIGFTGFILILGTILFFTIPTDRSVDELWRMFWQLSILAMSWSFVFTIGPAVIFGYFLTFLMQRDFKQAKSSKRRSILTGATTIGLLGLSISFFVAFTVFRPTDQLIALGYGIPATIIATIVGAWGGVQVYQEIYDFQEKNTL